MIQVQEILKKKGKNVIHIDPDASVLDAISLMTDNDVGALPVMQKDTLIGILSDKDYRTKIILKNRTSRDTPVKEIMTPDPITITPEDTIEACMEIMTQKKIRHLPVVVEERVVGIVSIGDMVKSIIDQQEAEISDLRNYISGSYPS